MENNNLLPAKKQNGFLSKIKIFFKSIIGKKSEKEQYYDENVEQNNADIMESKFLDSLKENTDIESASKKETIEYIVDTIEKNPQTLSNLTTEQLEDVNEYYTEKIEKVDEEITKLKK